MPQGETELAGQTKCKKLFTIRLGVNKRKVQCEAKANCGFCFTLLKCMWRFS